MPNPEGPWTMERREEIVGETAYLIDKFCTGGGEHDFDCAAAIVRGVESEVAKEWRRANTAESQLQAVREWAEKAKVWSGGSASDYDAGIGAAAREVLSLLNPDPKEGG